MPWHITPIDNVESILKEGLQPRIGERSRAIGEEIPAVYLFSSVDAFLDAQWIGDVFDEDAKLAILHVAIPANDLAWIEVPDAIPPHLVTLIDRDIDNFIPRAEHRALDLAALDPSADMPGPAPDP